jgi:hypothetical protein
MSESERPNPTPAGKQEALRRVGESWTDLMAAFAGIPPERVNDAGVTGDWSIKDLVAHIAFWDGQAEIEAERLALGDRPRSIDVEALNEREQAASAKRGFDEVWQELEYTHQRMLTKLKELPALDPRSVGVDTFDHYAEHAAEIRAWRERNGL